MLAFSDMLINPAKQAGMKVPENTEDYNKEDYPHFFVFCQVQLGKSMRSPTEHWENAKAIALVPDDKIMLVSLQDLVEQYNVCY